MTGKKSGSELSVAIDQLADCVENGHLLASMGGADLLIAATEEIRTEVERIKGRVLTR